MYKNLRHHRINSFLCFILCFFMLSGCENNKKDDNSITDDYSVNHIAFYSDVETAKDLMNKYDIASESEEVSSSGQLQTLIEYNDIMLYDEKWDLTLCFTSLGLIGFNYRSRCSAENIEQEYQKWIQKTSDIYGEPSTSNEYIAEWNNAPLGEKTSILIMQLTGSESEYGVQISFFADDTGSEISK